MIKLVAYYQYWKDNRLHSRRVFGPLSLEAIDLIARYGSTWEDEMVAPIYPVEGPGELIIKVIRE